MAIDFDGTGDELSNTAAFPLTNLPLTMAVWFNPDSITVTDGLISLANSDNSQRISLLSAGAVASDPVQMQREAGAGADNTSTSAGYSAGAWQHACCALRSATSADVYLNGGSKTSDATSRNPTVDRIWLGTNGASGASSYSGLLADAAVWNIDLTDAEIALLAKGISPMLIRPHALVAYMPLVRDPYNDIVRGVNLTVGGNPTVVAHPPAVGWYPYKIGGKKKIAAAGGSRGIFRSPIFGSGVFGKRIAA